MFQNLNINIITWNIWLCDISSRDS